MLKTDIQIAQPKCCPLKRLPKPGIGDEDIEPGPYKAKLSLRLWDKIKDRPDGKLILVTAITRLCRRG